MAKNNFEKLSRSDAAISPVIGTILMIAATVIIAGAVYAAVNAYSGHSSKPPTDSSWKATTLDNGSSTQQVRVTYLAGASNADASVNVKNAVGATVASYKVAPPAAWDPGDFAVYEPAAPGTYYVTIVLDGSTVMDGTVDVR